MGKRKKATNVVKIDLGDIFKKEEALPVLVQHSSKDRRRIERTVHSIPVLQPSQPPQPNPLSFDPCPMVAEYEDDVFIDTELHDEGNDGDTGGKGSITQWVHTKYMEGSETIRLTFTQWARGGYFSKVPTKAPTG